MTSNKTSFPLRHRLTGLSLSSLKIILLSVWENLFLKWEWWRHYVSNRLLFKETFFCIHGVIFSSLNCHPISNHQFTFIREASAKYTYFKYLLLHLKVKSLLHNLASVDPDPKDYWFHVKRETKQYTIQKKQWSNPENSVISREGTHYIMSSEQ